MPNSTKRDKILTGLRALCVEQTPGRTYTCTEIAARCGCSAENIGQIEKKAKLKVKQRLRTFMAEFEA